MFLIFFMQRKGVRLQKHLLQFRLNYLKSFLKEHFRMFDHIHFKHWKDIYIWCLEIEIEIEKLYSINSKV